MKVSEDVKIRVSRETREALKDMGRKGQSYDVVIRCLLHIKECAEIESPGDLEHWMGDFPKEAEAR